MFVVPMIKTAVLTCTAAKKHCALFIKFFYRQKIFSIRILFHLYDQEYDSGH